MPNTATSTTSHTMIPDSTEVGLSASMVVSTVLWSVDVASQRCRKVMKSGGATFLIPIKGGLGACPPEIFWVFSCSDKLLVQSEAKILIELLNICG